MSGADEHDRGHNAIDPVEERLRGRLRIITGGTFLGLIVVLTLASTFGRPAGLEVDPVIFGSLMGALLIVLGVEGVARWVKRP